MFYHYISSYGIIKRYDDNSKLFFDNEIIINIHDDLMNFVDDIISKSFNSLSKESITLKKIVGTSSILILIYLCLQV